MVRGEQRGEGKGGMGGVEKERVLPKGCRAGRKKCLCAARLQFSQRVDHRAYCTGRALKGCGHGVIGV